MSREELLKAVEKIRNKSRIGNNKHYHEVIKPNVYKPIISKFYVIIGIECLIL